VAIKARASALLCEHGLYTKALATQLRTRLDEAPFSVSRPSILLEILLFALSLRVQAFFLFAQAGSRSPSPVRTQRATRNKCNVTQYILTLADFAAGSTRVLLWACQVYSDACPSRVSTSPMPLELATTTLYVSVHQLIHAKFTYALLLRKYVLNVSSTVAGTTSVWCHAPCCNSAKARRKMCAHAG
jgi:hypothetical protein